jgi:hypothetical protein
VPTNPPDGRFYMTTTFEECGVPGGTQLTLMPWSIIGFVIYTGGYPCFVAWTLLRNRELIMEDQLLRAKGVGGDRLTNPHAYDLRKRFSRSYYQFKPGAFSHGGGAACRSWRLTHVSLFAGCGFSVTLSRLSVAPPPCLCADYFFWILLVILRKFCIAASMLLFNRSPAFQMAACLIVVFCAFGLQVAVRPYMSPSEHEDVLRAHTESSFTSAIHARLRAAIAGIETRGRKRTRRNLMTAAGHIDRTAVLGCVAGGGGGSFSSRRLRTCLPHCCHAIACP